MNIVKQSAKVLGRTPETRFETLEWIEKPARCCYQSYDKITEGSAKKICDKLVKREHWAMIEHSWVCCLISTKKLWNSINSNFLWKKEIDGKLYIAGNWRAWLEMIDPDKMAQHYKEMPILLDIHWKSMKILYDNEVPQELRAYTVQFITDRAVTHELVRHRPCSFAQKSQRYCADRDNVDFIIPPWYVDAKEGSMESHNFNRWKEACSKAEIMYHKLLANGEIAQQARTVLPNSTATEIYVTAPAFEWELIFKLRCAPDAYPPMRELMSPVRSQFITNRYI